MTGSSAITHPMVLRSARRSFVEVGGSAVDSLLVEVEFAHVEEFLRKVAVFVGACLGECSQFLGWRSSYRSGNF